MPIGTLLGSLETSPAEYGQNFHSKKNRAFRRKRDRRRRAALGGKKPKALN